MALPATPDTNPEAGQDARSGPSRARIVLIRHGRPGIAIRPRTGHQGFHAYIADYEQAGLDPASLPPAELHDLVAEAGRVFTSVKKRAHESAALLAPHAELAPNPIFVEAPLAAPRIPLLRMTVTKWAVIARMLWHAGYHPEIEAPAAASHRARAAAKFLIDHASREGTAILVAHGYFNFLIGRVLLAKGFQRTGRDRARFWNAVIYEKEETS